MKPSEAALATLDAFMSVGASVFTIYIKSLGGAMLRIHRSVPADEVRRTLPGIVADANAREQSVIIRPYSDSTAFVQLDDVDAQTVQLLAPLGFMALRTSPGSYQVWIALESQGYDADLDFARRLKRGTPADANATEATRCGGSRNFQEKHRANGFPVVDVKTHPGCITTRAALECLGIVAVSTPIEQPAPRVVVTPRTTGGAWPSYEVALQRAPRKADGSPDCSAADLAFALTAISWGQPTHEIADRLSSMSARAAKWRAERGDAAWAREIERTVQYAERNARPR